MGFDEDLGVEGVVVKLASDHFKFALAPGEDEADRLGRFTESTTFLPEDLTGRLGGDPAVLGPGDFFIDWVNDPGELLTIQVLEMDAAQARLSVSY